MVFKSSGPGLCPYAIRLLEQRRTPSFGFVLDKERGSICLYTSTRKFISNIKALSVKHYFTLRDFIFSFILECFKQQIMPPKDRIHHVISGRVNRSSGLSNTATRVGQMSENIQNLLAAPNPLDSSLAESPPAIPDFTASTETASTRPASIATAPLHTHLHPQVPNRSAFAELFGDDHPDVPHLYGTGRSGFTPILINYPTPVVSALERAHRNAELALQQKRLEGWTSHELLFMYAMERPGAIANDLSNPIHPLLTRDQWNVSKKWPLGAGFEGCWDIKNPIVWEIMQPILRLATQFLTNTHILTWYVRLISFRIDNPTLAIH